MVNYDARALQLLKRGGITARNWLRTERNSEGWEAPATPTPLEDRCGEVGSGSAIGIMGGPPLADGYPGGKHRSGRIPPPKSCRAADVRQETSYEATNLLLIAQESYDA